MTDWNSRNVFILVMVVIALIALPFFITNRYWQHLLIMALVSGVLGMTFSMIFCCAGMVTLGTGAFIAIGGYSSTLLVMKLGLSFWLAMPLAVIITGVVALGFGLVSIRTPGVPFVLLTMIMAEIVTQLAGQIGFFGGWGGFIMIPPPDPIGPIEFRSKVPFYFFMLALFFLVILVFRALYTSRIGRVWRAISLSPDLAKSLGINVYRYRLLAFVIASCTAGLVGSFYVHYTRTLAPATFGGFFSILVQLYPILGGIHYYLLGPTLGAAIMTIIPEFLRIAEDVEPIITGLLVLILVLFFPGGILGSIKQFPSMSADTLTKRIGEIRTWMTRK